MQVLQISEIGESLDDANHNTVEWGYEVIGAGCRSKRRGEARRDAGHK
jgi:hypothetical protein